MLPPGKMYVCVHGSVASGTNNQLAGSHRFAAKLTRAHTCYRGRYLLERRISQAVNQRWQADEAAAAAQQSFFLFVFFVLPTPR